MNSVVPVVLCGGSGTRLWPLSRAGFPKQFLCLSGKESLFQSSVMRLNQVVKTLGDCQAPIIVTHEDHRFMCAEQLREINESSVRLMLEPIGKNTAPAVTLAALEALHGQEKDDPILIVTPADQMVSDTESFAQQVHTAINTAKDDGIVILGITPTHAETAYGYIKTTAQKESAKNVSTVLSVERFIEKPTAEKAQAYCDDGGYFWNAGIFVMKASVWMKAINHFRPDIAQATTNAWKGAVRETLTHHSFIRPHSEDFRAINGESVDYAVLEKLTQNAQDQPTIKMVPLSAGWSDVGSWDAVLQMLPQDSAGNATVGDALLENCHHTLIHAHSRLVAAVGVSDIGVIETADAVLVINLKSAQAVKKMVDQLKTREESALHRKVHRPWGWYDSIDEGGRHKVKRIMVKPGASLSLQKHHHRAEHWIVVQGTAEVTCGDRTLLLTENQSTYIPLGKVHRLTNPGSIALEIIEVQSGAYLGEDDIVRLEDRYGRG